MVAGKPYMATSGFWLVVLNGVSSWADENTGKKQTGKKMKRKNRTVSMLSPEWLAKGTFEKFIAGF
jgi:hypothetical protein